MISYPANNTWSWTYRQSWQEIITSTDKKLKAAVSAPGANYCNGCQTSNVWRRNMSRSRESRPRGSRKQQTKITFAARAPTLNRFKKNYHGAQGFALLAHSLLLDDLIMQCEYDKYATQSVRSEKNSELYHHQSTHRTTNTC